MPVFLSLLSLSVQSGTHLISCLRVVHSRQYETVLKVSDNSDVEIIKYLARAHYSAGHLDVALATLQKAAHIKPEDIQIWFDIALIQKQMCEESMRAKVITTVATIKAQEGMASAHR